MRKERDDGGFSLIEVLVAMVVMGILIGLVVGPWSAYNAAHNEVGSERDLIAELRSVQQLAMTHNTTFRVDFTAQQAQVMRWSGSAYATYSQLAPSASNVHYANAAFTGTSQTGPSAYFFANGTATPGSVQVIRDGNAKVYRVLVDGLTARVYDGASGD